jgi:chromate transporter
VPGEVRLKKVRLKSDTTKMQFDKPSLREITWQVCYDVNRTLGGHASMELMRRTFGARGWLTDEGHALLVAVSRVTPGTNILAYCVGLGWQLGHWRGGLAALAAASVPASVLIALLSATLVQVDQHPVVRVVIAVALIVATVLVFSVAWHLLRPHMKGTNAIRAGIIALVVVMLVMMRVTPIRILLVAAMLGVVMASPAAPAVTEVER